MGEHLPCAARSVAEVRGITEEVPAVWALMTMTLASRTVHQVSVIIPTLRPGGTVMVEARPGPLGLCLVRGVTEVEQSNLGGQPRVTPNRGKPSGSDGRVCDRNTRDMPGGRRERHR